MKQILIHLLLFTVMQSYSQTRTDLSKLTFKEGISTILNGKKAEGRQMYNEANILSYGLDNFNLAFQGYIPPHVEVLALNGTVAGFGMKITSFKDQESIKKYLLSRYPGLKLLDSTKFGDYYGYKGEGIVIDFRSIPEASYLEHRTAYLDIKTADMAKEIDRLEKRYERPPQQ